ncbi:Nuclear factor of activated T-cells [Nibea albiflora]|uniref:Nuclear factor of activated T-cells n=1 Tax=Nibea albiflora TaxID=240163 RepID=A0ACB7ES21_NIBAL|nr:Nuclear factor of activated T-cells [Nibea albiflora]
MAAPQVAPLATPRPPPLAQVLQTTTGSVSVAPGLTPLVVRRGSTASTAAGRRTSTSRTQPNHSPGPSPQTSPRLSVTEESWLPNTNQYTNSAILAAINALTTDGVADLGEGIPMKARKTSQEHNATVSLKVEPGGEELSPGDLCLDEHPANRLPLKKEGYCGGFLDVPQHPYSWSKPKQYVSPSLPALDWQLPSSSGPYSLQIDVQPKSHHRAHYETEGSRGAVKALAGGHPVVQLHGYMESEPLTLQLFIGTADDRLLRPHAFYQVHRITGKTVSTPSHEALHNNTKVLEIPLLPENNMRAIPINSESTHVIDAHADLPRKTLAELLILHKSSTNRRIDCAGILKLRNSDIELRKGETDIGRKNTRVRMVFRVHINQPTGRTVSLQAASNPIECWERMLLDGHNFQHDSKVVFVEKAQDGHHLWETEAKVDRDASKSNSLLVEIPPYRNQRLSTPVHVNFYVCNGKRKRSQYQRFTYVPASVPTIKTEPHDDYDAPLVCSQHGPGLSLHPKPYFPPQVMTPGLTSDLRPCVVGGAYSVSQQRLAAKPSSLPASSSPSTSPKLHDLSPSPFSKCLPAGPPVQLPGQQPHVSIIQETPGRYQPPNLYPPSSSSSSPTSQPSTPTDAPFSPTHCMTPGSTSPGAQQQQQQHPKVPERGRASLQEDRQPAGSCRQHQARATGAGPDVP